MTRHLSTEIYKLDSKGKIRTWQYVVEGDKWWTIAGLQDGNKVTSAPTICTPASRPTAEEQALFEAAAEMQKKLKRDYHTTIEGTAKAKYFAPMLAEKYDPKLVQEGDLAQPKLDGIRCIATVNGLRTRKGEVISSCPHIIEQLAPVFAKHPDLILDGELYNHDLKDNFNELASIIRKKTPDADQIAKAADRIEYHVYDMVLDMDFAAEALDRNASLTAYLGEAGPSIILVATAIVDTHEEVREFFKQCVDRGYEGAMVRSGTAGYHQKRSKALLKFKEFQTEEFVIDGIEEGVGNWAGYAKRVIARLPDGRAFGAGVKGDQAFTRKLLDRRSELLGKSVTIRFFELTPDGIPRFPVAIDFDRPDA